jgi:hypothetical protein
LLRAASFVGATDLVVAPSPDAVRVRDAISRIASMSDADRARINLPRDLADLLDRLARQAATADALRLFTGGLFAGNVSLTGALLDFGVARALYSWASLQLHSHAQGFGHDLERLVNFADAIQFYARKASCAGTAWFMPEIQAGNVRHSYLAALREMFGRIWADELLDEESRRVLRDATQEYFEHQQRIRLRELWSGKRPAVDWVHDELTGDEPPPAGLALAARAVLSRHGPALAEKCWRSATRMLLPRAELDRSRLERRVARVLRDATSSDRPARVAGLIEGAIGRSRRWWPDMPADWAVTSQRVIQGCSALEGSCGEGTPSGWWLEGWLCESRFVWGAAELTDDQVQQLKPRVRDGRWHCTVGHDGLPDAISRQFARAAHLEYPAPPQWWKLPA